ncbi:MAG: DNA-processing protein DprA [Eubacteriales bacterium]|nr:DNA-processing protein DprA [Eubacteriales bacterium]
METVMTLTEEQRSLLWLSTAEVTASRVHSLIRQYGSAAEIRARFGTEDGPTFQGKTEKILAVHREDSALNQLCERLFKQHVHLLFYMDENYPQWLRSIDDFPYLLYYAGRLSCLDAPMVGVVGTRKASQYGLEMARSIGYGLAQAGVTVVSGLARGIDGAAHEGALSADGCTIGVLGCGINAPYPPEHTPLLRRIAGGKGLILSEYPLDAEPIAFHFPYRNRIISGLSCAVVFVEGAVKSGGMHTVNSALIQGREVFAVPGRVGAIGSEGPHTILREGARIATSAGDILDDLGLRPLSNTATERTLKITVPIQRDIAKCLRLQPLTVEKLAGELRLTVNEIMPQLSIMEINGLILREAGNEFSLPPNARE